MHFTKQRFRLVCSKEQTGYSWAFQYITFILNTEKIAINTATIDENYLFV